MVKQKLTNHHIQNRELHILSWPSSYQRIWLHGRQYVDKFLSILAKKDLLEPVSKVTKMVYEDARENSVREPLIAG